MANIRGNKNRVISPLPVTPNGLFLELTCAAKTSAAHRFLNGIQKRANCTARSALKNPPKL